MTTDRPTVVYIASYGHSGSTLLDLLISSHPEVVSVGELVMLHRGGEPSACTCGAPSPWRCEFWQTVDDEMRQRYGLRLAELEVADGTSPVFAQHNYALFDAVRRVTGRSVIVDSSKQVDRLRGLRRCQDVDLRVIVLTRHPCAVVYSYLRKGRPSLLHAARRGRRMALTRRLVNGLPTLPVTYELLATRPSEELRSAMRFLGLSFQPDQLRFTGRTRHNIGGNRMRFDHNNTIAPDAEWQRRLSVSQKVAIPVVSAVAGLAVVNAVFDLVGFGSSPSGSRE